jgi:hypothetical protein
MCSFKSVINAIVYEMLNLGHLKASYLNTLSKIRSFSFTSPKLIQCTSMFGTQQFHILHNIFSNCNITGMRFMQ